MTVLLGLTGSIGMGKSTTARMFAQHDIDVWDADAAVHDLYRVGGAGAAAIASHWPEIVNERGVDRTALGALLARDPSAFPKLEALVHPLLAEHRAAFVSESDADIILFDIPLLFETNADEWLDYTCVVSVDPETQRARVLARDGMSKERFELILSRQMPDAQKRARADWVIQTDTLEHAQKQVDIIVSEIRKVSQNA